MINSNEDFSEEGVCSTPKSKDNLVLTINSEGRIVKFNKICEQISGYIKDDVVNNNFFDRLIPERYFDLWLEFFDHSQQNKMLHDFKLPFLTKNGHEIMVSWSSFPVKNSQDDKIHIDLVGSIISSWKDYEAPKLSIKKDISVEKPKTKPIFSKKVRFGKNNNVIVTKLKSENEELHKQKIILENTLKTFENQKDNNYGDIIELNDSLEKKNELLEKQLKELQSLETNNEKKLKILNNELEKKTKILEKKLKDSEAQEAHYKEKLEKTIKQSNIIVNKGLYSFSELYGGKKRKEELENKINELNERENILNTLEKKLIDDKEKFDQQVEEFSKWREKLESLEGDIEKRRMDLMNQERILLSDITGSDDISVEETTKEDLKRSYDVFEKIDESAAIIQRGIFKRVNDSFVDLIGYNLNEILNRSLFDFISPEGFSGMEKYYLNRLKGEKISTYSTVILAKDNIKIPVEINSNPTFIEGEKAEIAVFKKSDETNGKIVDEVKKEENKEVIEKKETVKDGFIESKEQKDFKKDLVSDEDRLSRDELDDSLEKEDMKKDSSDINDLKDKEELDQKADKDEISNDKSDELLEDKESEKEPSALNEQEVEVKDSGLLDDDKLSQDELDDKVLKENIEEESEEIVDLEENINDAEPSEEKPEKDKIKESEEEKEK